MIKHGGEELQRYPGLIRLTLHYTYTKTCLAARSSFNTLQPESTYIRTHTNEIISI